MEAVNVERKLKAHEDKFEQVDKALENQQEQINQLKSSQEAFQSQVAELKSNLGKVQTGQAEIAKTQKEMEVTLMKEGQANRELVQDTKEISKTLLDHVLKKDEKETEAKEQIKKMETAANEQIRKMKWDIVGKVSLALFGTGGVCYVLFDLITK